MANRNKVHVRKDEMVVVIAGKDKGKQGKVKRVLPKTNRVVVEGVNIVKKHVKPSAKNQQGGRLSKEMPIDASNVMLYCGSCNRGVRVGHRFTAEGRKQRYCKSCSASLGDVGPAKPARAVKKG